MLATYELNRERDESMFVGRECDNVCHVHFHRKVEVMYVTEGVKKFFASGKEMTLGKDCIFLRTVTKCTDTRKAPAAVRRCSCFPTICCATITTPSVTSSCRAA